MRIAYYSHYYAPEIGAPSARIREFALQWIAMGHEVEVVTCFPNHPGGKIYPGYKLGSRMRERIDGIDISRHWTYITPNTGIIRKSIGHFSFWPSAVMLSNPCLAKPDVVIGTSPTFFAPLAAYALARKYNIPFLMEIRDLWPAIFVELGILRNRFLIRLLTHWELAMYRRATRIVTVTESFRKDLIARGIPSPKVFNVPNGADADFWDPVAPCTSLRERLGLSGKFIVLYIGAHGISQALTRILESAKMLSDTPHIQFVFVGDGAEKNKLILAAREARLSNTRFLNPVDRASVREYYSIADVCLVPLRNIPLFDTFIPSKMFEMMAMARPIVASVRGEAAGILNSSGGAIVVEPENSNAVAEAIRHVYSHPETSAAMARRARAFVMENYSRRSLAENYLKVLQAAIEAHEGQS